MADATDTRPDIDPDRAGFTLAVQAAGVIAGTVIDLVGAIGRIILANLMPDCAPRSTSARYNEPYRNTTPERPISIRPGRKPPPASSDILAPPSPSTSQPSPN